ncbi:MAG: glycosyltransferase family 2 protein [Paludibacter sp.]|nr:glycosyltransferase family 2 protein [Paludibacter sp.]
MRTAVVILNWNGEKFLNQFLPVLLRNTQLPGVDIYVADNASTDNSLSLIEEQFPTVKTLLLDKNYGFAGGYNKALAQINADYFVLLNSDVEVTENWLQPLLNYMNENADVAACQPKIKSFYNRDYFEHAGASGGFIDYLGFPFCRGRVVGTAEMDRGQYDTVIDVFWATGACLLIRSELYNQVGGLDDEFFAHMEEIDLCWRLKGQGFRIVCIPQSEVYHVGGGTLQVEHPHKTYLNFRNNLLMLYKNLPQKSLSNIMRWRMLFDYAAAFQLFVTGKPQNAKSVLEARKDFKKMLPGFVDKRIENLSSATRTDFPEMLRKSIVIEYYLKGNKTYSKLIK